MREENTQRDDAPRARKLLLWFGIAIGLGVLAVYGFLALSWEAGSGQVLIVEKAGDTNVEPDEQAQTVNLTEADLVDLPQLRRALDQANRTGAAGITDRGEIDEVCRFLEPRTGLCGGQLLYKGHAYKVGIQTT